MDSIGIQRWEPAPEPIGPEIRLTGWTARRCCYVTVGVWLTAESRTLVVPLVKRAQRRKAGVAFARHHRWWPQPRRVSDSLPYLPSPVRTDRLSLGAASTAISTA